MAEPLSIKLDDSKLQRKLQRLAEKSGVEVGFIVEDQMRLWVNDILRQTEPKSLKIGRERIRNDAERLFTPIDDQGAIKAWKEQAVKEAGQDVFTRTKRGGMRISQKQLSINSVQKMKSIHRANRSKKGGVRKKTLIKAWGGEGIVPRPLFNKFLKEQYKRVGFLKSRFGKAALHYARRTNGRTPAYKNWIRKHIPGGSVSGKIDRFGNGSISSINDATYAAQRMLGKSWWTISQGKRQRDLTRGGFKRMSDLANRFNMDRI